MAGRPCTVCTHRDRRDIEARAAGGDKARSISMDFGISEQALSRHLATHAIRSMEKAAMAAGAKDLAAGLGLNEEVIDLQARTLAILTKAEKSAKTHSRALLAIREARANLELLGKFTGKLKPETQVNVLVASGEWLAFRDRLYATLERFPDALAAVDQEFRAVAR